MNYNVPGPLYYSSNYAKFETTSVWESSGFDWQSIMLVDGSEFALEGRRVMFKADGAEIDISHNLEPSDNDIRMVRWLYRKYAKTSDTPPYDNPPTYQEATSK